MPQLFRYSARIFSEQKFAAVLTAENANFLAGDLGNIAMAAQRGVRMATLVWNGENELGAGAGARGSLTAFGRAAVAEMERCGIIVDVSHLNDEGFWDLCKIAKKPFVASHSNARAVANRSRNLTDAQICEIVRRKGLIGLNFYTNFLRADGWEPSLDDLYRHAVHFLELGAADALALGSDYDGAKTPPDLDSVEKSLRIFSYFLSRGMPEKTADAILFKNAWRFFQRNL
jgi:membrane dipeptidase